MPFNTITGSEAGKISKRGKELPLEITTGLQELAMSILTDLKLNELTVSQKIKLLDIVLRHSLPKDAILLSKENVFENIQIEIIQ